MTIKKVKLARQATGTCRYLSVPRALTRIVIKKD
jgi:hypothetical protein